MASEVNGLPLEGSIDEAAAAIEALMNGPAEGAAAAPADEEEAVAAQIEANQAPKEQNPDEVAAEAEKPVELPQGESTTQAKVEPQPAIKPVPQAAPKPAETKPLTAQDQLAQLNQLVPVLQGQLYSQFPEARDPNALLKMSVEDPARYVAYVAHLKHVERAQGLQAQAQSAFRDEWVAAETTRLHELVPEIADPAKGPALQAELTAYAKEAGYSDQQIMWAAATDVKMLHDAMQYRKSQAASAAKDAAAAKALEEARNKAKEAPPVQKPGVAKATDKKTDKLKELEQRFDKSGRVDDLAALLEARGG